MRMSKPWVELSEANIDALPAQLGVYEISGDPGGTGESRILRIGYAGGTEVFGMRTALHRERVAHGDNARFRLEFTHGYLTRWQELLMLFEADHGQLPPNNAAEEITLGRLSPGAPK